MSYQSLEKLLGFEKALPATEDWSAAQDFLQHIGNHCLQNKPHTVVECSSGTSSLVLAKCCSLNQNGHVYSFENGLEYAANTRQHLNEFSLSDYCDVLYTPLCDVNLNSESYQWYDLSNIPELSIDLLVIDGPPGFIQKHSRYPALPMLYDKLADECVIYLDDAAREDEQELVARWLEMYPEFQHTYIDNERGCSILKR